MAIKKASRFREIREPLFADFEAKMASIIEDYERKRIKWYRLSGADCPEAGHRNHALKNILTEVVKEGWDYYPTETNAVADFKEAATIYQRRIHDVAYSTDDIIALPGVAAGFWVIHNAILDPGDEIATIEPAHYMWGPSSYMYYLGAKVVQVPMVEEDQWTTDLDALRKTVNIKTKAIVISSPNNPTGHIYSEKEVKAIADVAGEHNIPIISDELYCSITYDGNEAPSMAKICGDVPVVVFTSLSKFFMAPGWRIGYMAFHDPRGRMTEVRKVCKMLAETYGHPTSGIALPILVAASRALLAMERVRDELANAQDVKSPMCESMEMLRKLQKQRDYIYKRLCEIDGIRVVNSMATLYMFPRVEGIGNIWKTNEDFILELMKEERVAFLTGSHFGNHGFGHFRTLVLNDVDTLQEVFNRLDRFMKRHTKQM